MSETSKTREEVEGLKAAWASDACWDIEDIEGFEAYRDELLAFRKEKEAEWEAAYQARLTDYAKHIGVPGKIDLAKRHRDSMKHRDSLVEKANEYLIYYLGKVLDGDSLNQRECRTEIGMIVDFIVEAVEESCRATVAVEIAKAKMTP